MAITKPNWHKLENESVYLDMEEDVYVVVLETTDTKIESDQWLEAKGFGLIDAALDSLAFYYEKVPTNEHFAKLKENTMLLTFFLEERAGALLRFKYGVDRATWDQVVKELEEEEEEELLISDIAIYMTTDLEKRFKDVVEHLRNIGKKIERDGIDIRPFDASLEADILEQFPSTIKALLVENGQKFREDEDDEIVINFTDEYEVESIYLIKGFDQIKISNGLNLAKTKEPLGSPRAMKYAASIDKMYADCRAADPKLDSWYEFLKKYTLDLPDWSPSKQKEESAVAGLVKHSKAFDVLKDEFTEHYKSAKQILSETAELTAEFKLKTAQSLAGFEELVEGEQIIERLRSSAIGNLEDLYKQILNKISLENLLRVAANSIASCIPFPEALTQWRKGGLLSLKPHELMELGMSVLGSEFESVRSDVNSSLGLPSDCEPNIRGGAEEKKYKKEFIDRMYEKLEELGLIGEIEAKIESLMPHLASLDYEDLTKLDTYVGLVDEMIEDRVEGLLNKLPKPPTVTIPDSLPITDFLAELPKQLENLIVETVEQAMIQMVKNLATIAEQVENIGPTCRDKKDPENYGNISDSDLVRSPEDYNALDNILDRHGIPGEDIMSGSQSDEDFGDGEVGEEAAEELPPVASLLRGALKLLTNQEACQLLQGRPTEQTLAIIKGYLKREYDLVYEMLGTDRRIAQLFADFGEVLDLSVCYIPVGGDTRATSPCEPIPTENAFGNMPEGLLDIQRENERNTNKKDLEDIAGILQNGGNLDELIPTKCDENSMSRIAQEDPSFKHITDLMFRTVVEPIVLTFNIEASSFKDQLIDVKPTKSIQQINDSGFDGKVARYVLPSLVGDLQAPGNFTWNGQNGKDDITAFELSQKDSNNTITYGMVGIPSFTGNNDEEDENEVNVGVDKADDVSLITTSEGFTTVVQRLDEESFYKEYLQPTTEGEYLNQPQKSIVFRNLLEQTITGGIRAYEESLSKFLERAANKDLYEIMEGMIEAFAQASSESKYFNEQELSTLEIIQPDNLLMDIEKIKEDAKKRREELICKPDCDPKKNTTKAALLEMVIKLTMRLYAIQGAMSDVFSYSILKYDADSTQLNTSILLSDVDDGIQKLGYAEQFDEAVLKMVQESSGIDFQNVSAAKELVLKEQMQDIEEPINNIFNANNVEVSVLDRLPVTSPPNVITDERLSLDPSLTKLNLHVEEYVRVRKKENSVLQLEDGVWSLERFQEEIDKGYLYATTPGIQFDNFSYGMRVMLTLDASVEKIFSIAGDDADYNMRAVQREKCYLLVEGGNADTNSINIYQNSPGQKFYTWPLVTAEQQVEDIDFIGLSAIAGESLASRYPRQQLKKTLLDSQEGEALEYCLSRKDAIALISLYNKMAVNSRLDFDKLFDNTKRGLRDLFYLAVNTDYRQEVGLPPEFVGDYVSSTPTAASSSDIAGMAAKMAAQTPIWLIKFLAEKVDPHTMLAEVLRKAADAPSEDFTEFSDKLLLLLPPGQLGVAYRALAFLEE
jgi:hypothetical protein